MGVDRRDYIVVGVDIESRPDDYYKGDIDDFCDKYYWQDTVGNITFIDDLYNGEYFIIGEVLQACDGYNDGLDYNFIGKEKIIENAKVRVKAFIKEHLDIETHPYVIIKTQWS
jgi:hypothetical protein